MKSKAVRVWVVVRDDGSIFVDGEDTYATVTKRQAVSWTKGFLTIKEVRRGTLTLDEPRIRKGARK
jgi:hypothetical protein